VSVVRSTIDGLAKFLGAESHQAEVVYSERSARAALSRRGLFKAAGAVAAGVAFVEIVGEEVALATPREVVCPPPPALRYPMTTGADFSRYSLSGPSGCVFVPAHRPLVEIAGIKKP
jgi:hypothetical protein